MNIESPTKTTWKFQRIVQGQLQIDSEELVLEGSNHVDLLNNAMKHAMRLTGFYRREVCGSYTCRLKSQVIGLQIEIGSGLTRFVELGGQDFAEDVGLERADELMDLIIKEAIMTEPKTAPLDGLESLSTGSL